MYDITILTDHRYVHPETTDDYTLNVLLEDRLVKEALERKGLRVHRTSWDNPDFNWSTTKYVLFRTTWDYFDRFDEFEIWLDDVSTKTKLINEKELIYWNIDKHYLLDLERNGVHLPPTQFIEPGDARSISDVIMNLNWDEFILKPAISGAARHTYRFKKENADQFAAIYRELIAKESMMFQEFQQQIISKGEVAYMVFGGKFSHAVLKKAKEGDFRVQDDFGGTIHEYHPNKDEIEFVENAFEAIDPMPAYARVDVIWDNNDELAIGEIELVEPELWFRMDKDAADKMANAIMDYCTFSS